MIVFFYSLAKSEMKYYMWFDNCPCCESSDIKQVSNDTNWSYVYNYYFYNTNLVKCNACGAKNGFIFKNIGDRYFKFKIKAYDKVKKIYLTERCRDDFNRMSERDIATLAEGGKEVRFKRCWDFDEKNKMVEFLCAHFDVEDDVSQAIPITKLFLYYNEKDDDASGGLNCFNWRDEKCSFTLATSPTERGYTR